jgi:catechol 2,3-dioxygenase-like lactoylglutathione lyase family enzyme
VPDLSRAIASFGWLLTTLGYAEYQNWDAGRSWRLGATYLVVEQSAAMSSDRHDRLSPGLNHLAFHVQDAATVEALAAEATGHGWRLMFPDSHPYAGGQEHYAAYLENEDGFEVELVAISARTRPAG